MAEYKDTLNLPNTAFPMKASLSVREPEMLADWQARGIYQKIRKARVGSKRFILHDGPPYANGHLHCGHALNKILKDIIIKSKTFSGFDAPFVPGWDCHGLPIELNVEKKVGKAGIKITPREFRAKCREYAASQIDIQREEFQRLGVLGDWYNPYVTMDYHYEANIVRALGLMIKNGHLQQGFKPVHWCIDCGSALAEAEVDYEDKTSPSIDVAFTAVNPSEFLNCFGTPSAVKPLILPIWTTTPWTLPANEAVCLHPEIDYSLIETGDSYYIVATDLVESAMARYVISHYKTLGSAKGRVFEHFKLQHPFYKRQVPVVLAEHVTTESGTGCVHTAPAHGPDDYLVGQTYRLPLINPVMANGCFAEDVELFAGLSVLKANEDILTVLSERGVLLANESIRHSYPHCWRHKSPMIFLATPQWFISMDKSNLRQAIVNEIEKVNWVPDWGKARISNMVENRPDWCISRQRSWGTPMPLFVHKTTRELHPDTLELIEKVAVMIEKSGIDAWFDLDGSELLGDDAKHYDKITDTMDVWLDSGISHFSVLKHNNDLDFPADVYFEGSDQHRGWFNSSLTTAVAMYGVAPYKTVLTHGYTVDAEGKKLSKSKGNYVALDKLVNQHGADILRLWVASTDYRHEVSISEEIIKRNADAYRRIRNTARFLLANLFDFNPVSDCIDAKELLELDRWALKRCQLLQEEIIAAYENYHFHLIYQKIHNFCAVDMGSFYLDLIKDRQYTTAKDSTARRSCQTAMYHMVKAFTIWLAPILSFTAEEIWQTIPGNNNESVFIEHWYDAWPTIDAVNMDDWEQLHIIRDEVNKALEETRQRGEIGSALAAEVTVYADDKVLPKLTRLGEELRFLLITSGAKASPINQSPKGLSVTDCGVSIQVIASAHEKCARCWHRRADVGQNQEHPELCLRCVGNISGYHEERRYI
ncbi:TPA: isoleucine--tRNA ligase [Legionella pneumophila]|uniref:Isoleucine--tRNA ligase n=1 Tax=Legionella pneumophila TaxID=446 RepID=A0A2S6F1Z9_LEGPN|nr:isoleucine--tRNA ligase [Legionella pneumophila]APF02747.1 isoleucine--tRNA ligase [Legionella pneumophila subsp. fraseri]APF05779.1 isoleucine--tRNA ligase [Legionella pneumophila subsp. fraseri]KXB26387.1 isoleucine--tRNA ligase [Legionella pneumophila]KXB26853.1 isoleucine--tRNA ligase [Legionella pneumophila]KZX34961.1 isoleucine--tRNA ligase [Legionella pneumophila]